MPFSTQLHIVTGKGGTGKTTVAAALALALADEGKEVLLCEVEGRQQISQLLDIDELPYEERHVASGRRGGKVYGLAIDPEAALLEYLAMYYRLGRAGRALDRFGIIEFATTIAPGVRDVLLTGKIYEAARRKANKDDTRFAYDAIVVDAPPTGRITRFLGVNDEVAGLAKVGPIRSQSNSIMEMLRSKQTRVHLVTVLEEMPVQETIDGIAELQSESLPVGNVIVNMVRPSLLSETTEQALTSHSITAEQIGKELISVDLPEAAATTLLSTGHDHLARQELQREQRDRLAAVDHNVIQLPMLSAGIDLGALFELADDLKDVIV